MNKKLNVFLVLLMLLIPFGLLSTEEYRVVPGDVLSIAIYDEQDLSGDFKISPKGTLTLNWLEPLDVQGLTLEEVKAKVGELLGKKYIKNPKVTNVSLKTELDNRDTVSSDSGITVLGAVTKQGVYKYKEGYTAMNAIIDAGNFTKFASKNRTLLVRGKGQAKKTFVLKMGDVMDRGDKGKDILLQPGDVLIAKEGFL